MNEHFRTAVKIGFILVILLGYLPVSNSLGQDSQDKQNKQYVQVNLKNGEMINFEYRSFIEMNFKIQPDSAPDRGRTKSFGEGRVLFREKDTCQEQLISLDNLQEMEFMGICADTCTQQKEWLFKVYLLDLDKYEGFFLKVEDNRSKSLTDQGVKGRLLITQNTRSLEFDDIEKITFFAR